MQNPYPVHHSPYVCNKKIKHTDLCYFLMQLTWLNWFRSRSWCHNFWSRSHNRILVSVLVSISVSHSLVSVLALVSLCSGLINKPTWTKESSDGPSSFGYEPAAEVLLSCASPSTVRLHLSDHTCTDTHTNTCN